MPLAFDVICVPTATFGSFIFTNSEFFNWKTSYDEYPNCVNNRAIKNHGSASDATSGHFLTNVNCKNCDENALFKLDEPNV